MKAAALACVLLLVPAAHAQVVVKRVAGEIPADPAHAVWQAAPAAPVMLMGQPIAPPLGGGAVTAAELRAVHNGRQVAFALTWADTSTEMAREIASFQDMAALMFPSGGTDPSRVSPFMGDAENPAAIWLWRADFAADLDGSAKRRLDEEYPMYADFYNADNETTVHRYKARGTNARVPSAVEALVAAGFGTLSPDTAESVRGSAWNAEGRRTVIFTRALPPSGKSGAVFRPGAATGVNVAIWDGGAGERGSRKSVGMSWIPVEVE